jgi:L-cysteate sulfo-lyase
MSLIDERCDWLYTRLNAFPRVPLADYPTPLEYLPRLSRWLGQPIYIKRDDVIGPGLGGNKTRKLEYLLAEAQALGARRVATFGGLQSNHARITAAAAVSLGMEPHLFYFERRPARLTGNLLINTLLGARLHFVPFGGGSGGMTLETASRLAHLAAWALVGPHYFIPVGGHTWRGGLGYVRAALELNAQARERGIEHGRVVLAAGSGGTLAGLLAGLVLLDSPLRPLGIDVGRLWRGFPRSIARLADAMLAHLGLPPGIWSSSGSRITEAQTPLIEGTYVGQGYAVPSAAGNAAIRLLAECEGIVLDPVYTGKALAGLLDLHARGVFRPDEPLIFLHTGGLPALFA